MILEPGTRKTVTMQVARPWDGEVEDHEVEIRRTSDGVYFIEGFNRVGANEEIEKLGLRRCPKCRKMDGGGLDVHIAYFDPEDALGRAMSREDGSDICKYCGIAEGLANEGITFGMMRMAVANAIEEGRRMAPGVWLQPYTGLPLFSEGDLSGALVR